MAEDQGNKEDKFDQFTAAGESLGYVTLEQARILAIQHARDNTDFYGRTYGGVNLVWEVTSQEEGEDFYDIRLSFRPAGRFRGEPGVEQLIIDKTGNVQLRQILDEPSGIGRPSGGRPPRWWLRAAVGLVVIGVVAVGGLIVSGIFVGDGGTPSATPFPTERPAPTAAPVVGIAQEATVAPEVQVEPERAPVATALPAVQVERRRAPVATVAPTVEAFVPTPVPVATVAPAVVEQSVEPLLTVAISTPFVESNQPWTINASRLVPLRPMFEHLLDVDRRTGETVPMLAEKWEMSSDGTEWTFGLRDNVQFHSGYGEFNAEDVFYSMEMLNQEATPGNLASYWRDILRGVEPLDERTVGFFLTRPEPELAYQLSAARRMVMLSGAQWTQEGPDSIEKRPAGTGSYQYLERNSGEEIRFERVKDHWRRSPQFDQLRIIHVPEEATRLAVLLTGEGQIVELGRESIDQAVGRGMTRISSRLPAKSIARFMGGQYNSSPEKLDPSVPWLDVRVRRAINLAIDRDLLNEIFYGGRAEPMPVSGFHPSLPGWDPSWQPYPYDPESAKALLAEAGYADGFGFEMDLIGSFAQTRELLDIGEIMAEMLADVGIKPELVQQEYSALRPRIVGKQMHGALWPLPSAYRPLPDHIRFFNYSGGEGLLFAYEHPEIDKLYNLLSQNIEPGRRQAILRNLGNHKYQNYADIPLFWLKAEVGVNPDQVRNYIFPGSIAGSLTHLEYVEPAR